MERTQEEGESKGLPPLRRHKESMCKSKERGSRTRKERERADKSESLREKKTAKRELCVKKKIERREQSVAVFERNN